IDLNKLFNPKKDGRTVVRWATYPRPDAPLPERGDEFRGFLAGYWEPYWQSKVRGRLGPMTDTRFDDSGEQTRSSIPILSFFSRLEPIANPQRQNPNRFEFLRRGGRRLDVSNAIAAGALVVLAEADNVPIPFPLEVEGERIQGTGTTI